MSRHDDILARLKAATGPDRELDVRLHVALTKPQGIVCNGMDANELLDRADTYNDWPTAGRVLNASDYTTSIDATSALVEKMLPGWFWWAGHLDQADRRFVATIAEKAFPDWPAHRGIAPTAPLAILIALFEALKAKEVQHG